jgi:hypothetical protein
MSYNMPDRVRQTSTTTGTGNITFATTPTGWRSFASSMQAGDTFPYVVEGRDANGAQTSEWETGIGALTGGQLVRTTPTNGSNGVDTLVNFTSASLVCYVGINVDGFEAYTSQVTSVQYEAAGAIATHAGAADPHTGYQLESDVVETAAAGKAPKATSRAVLDPSWLALADCGDGSDGDLTVTGTVYLTRDMQYRTLTISGAGKVVTDSTSTDPGGWILRAWTLDVSAAAASAITGKHHTASGFAGTSSGTAGGGAANGTSVHYGATVGSSTPSVSGGAGQTAAGAAGSNAATSNGVVGGYLRGAGGAGGAGSGGAGGGGGTASASTKYQDASVPQYPPAAFVTLQSAGVSPVVRVGGSPGAGGGGGGGNGAAAGGGGGGGSCGVKPIDVRVGVLVVGSNTAAPMIDGRGSNGGAGGDGTNANTGGGGGGGGGGGARVHLDVGVIVADGNVAGWIDASGGNGGDGGDGNGTGVGGGGGNGGGGGRITVRRRVLQTVSETDTRDTAVTAGSAASGTTGGTGGAGVACLAGLLS